MNLQPIDMDRVRLGEPLAFSVFDRDGHLLLARDMVLSNEGKLERLRELGVYMDVDEVDRLLGGAPVTAPAKPTDDVANVLYRTYDSLKLLLFEPEVQPDFKAQVEGLGATVSDLVDQHPDRTIFHLIRWPPDHALYSVTHALQCAVASDLAARRLQLTDRVRTALVGAALTMNITITRLQGQLAGQTEPMSEAQRASIHEHPTRGVEMLRRLNVEDAVWLRCVQEHHETPEASGYPLAIAASFEPAEILRHVDIFMAKAIGRATREAIYPNQVMREVFLAHGGHPYIAVLIKEFGFYPPGTLVHLANNALAVVVARGSNASAPIACEIVSDGAVVLSEPIRRDCADPMYAVQSVVHAGSVVVPIDPIKLYVTQAA